MKRALMYASVASMIQQFNMNNIKLLQNLGYKVDVACNFEYGSTISKDKIEQLKVELNDMGVRYYHIPIPRKISDFKGIKVSYQKTKILMDDNKYNLIHCHSPIGGIVCRMANKNSENYKNSKMIYTAHGFHFFKGNNSIKNIIFRSIEKYAAKYTDILITINKEDYAAAKKFKLKKNGNVEYIPGIGIDLEKINSIKGKREELLGELNISQDAFLMLSVGELNENKNHKEVVETLKKLPDNVHYLICGKGNQKENLENQVREDKCESKLHLLGYRDDVLEVMKSCDLFVFPSKREGLSVALMEAMACGLPCIVSNIRGNCDLIENFKGGFLVDDSEYESKIKSIFNDSQMAIEMKEFNLNKVQEYDLRKIESYLLKVYSC